MTEQLECYFCGQELSAAALTTYELACHEWEAKRKFLTVTPQHLDHQLREPQPTCDECLADIAENKSEMVDYEERIARLRRRITRIALFVVGGSILLIGLWAWLSS